MTKFSIQLGGITTLDITLRFGAYDVISLTEPYDEVIFGISKTERAGATTKV